MQHLVQHDHAWSINKKEKNEAVVQNFGPLCLWHFHLPAKDSNTKARVGDGASLLLFRGESAAMWDSHVSKQPKGVVTGRVYGRGTVVLLCVITAFTGTKRMQIWKVTVARKDKDTLTYTGRGEEKCLRTCLKVLTSWTPSFYQVYKNVAR